MPVFEYRGLSAAGKNVEGLKEAESPKTLRSVLRKDGIFLTDVVGQAEGAIKPGGKAKATSLGSTEVNFKLSGGSVSTDDIAVMTRQLATLLKAGVSLVEALAAMVDQVEKEKLKRILSDVKQRVNEGSSLGDALNTHVKVFGPLFVNMIRAGESSGALDSVLLRLAEFTEGQARLKQKIVGTMIYPAIMLVIGGGVLIMLMTVVVPKVTKIFDDMKVNLPWTTKLLIWSSNFLQDYWFVVVPALIASAIGLYKWAGSEKGKPVWDRVVLKIPVFGPLVRHLSVARFTRTLATLLKSGVPLLTALDIVKNVITNSTMSAVVDTARDAIREGESIAAPLKKSGEFPPLVYHMVGIGERSGQLEDMLLNVAESYESSVNVRIGALTALLEPMMIVMMGAVIAFVAFSILMPILQMNSMVR
ncbi:MAG: type II secretion system inner membrane protein GspF [Archangium sp.]|nr:type II secretion system inner membrane protein GspF [Archangium sp.]MDP3157474.1 type II secretion system inner membrane protein GspF [Archangium sp.]MDP3572761.1 type II secretion system inner membrane protein GspF [Archangium sp.]